MNIQRNLCLGAFLVFGLGAYGDQPAELPASPTAKEVRSSGLGKPSAESLPALAGPPSLLDLPEYQVSERRYLNREMSPREFQRIVEGLERRLSIKDRPGARGVASSSGKPKRARRPPNTSPPPEVPTVTAAPEVSENPSGPPSLPPEPVRVPPTSPSRVEPALPAKGEPGVLPSNPGPKLSKRERLDALLKRVIEGKLPDEEYKRLREAITLEPE